MCEYHSQSASCAVELQSPNIPISHFRSQSPLLPHWHRPQHNPSLHHRIGITPKRSSAVIHVLYCTYSAPHRTQPEALVCLPATIPTRSDAGSNKHQAAAASTWGTRSANRVITPTPAISSHSTNLQAQCPCFFAVVSVSQTGWWGRGHVFAAAPSGTQVLCAQDRTALYTWCYDRYSIQGHPIRYPPSAVRECECECKCSLFR